MTIKIKQVNVTPDMARLWLGDLYEGQRGLARYVVEMYASDMRTDRWELTADTLKIDETGKLVDGQHRLQAVILADTTVPMFIAEGIPATAYAVLDQGKRRTFADLLEGAGVPYSKVVAASVRAVYAYATNRSLTKHGYETLITIPGLMAWYDANPGLADFAPRAGRIGAQFKFPQGVLCAFLYLAEVSKGADLDLFIEQLSVGENLERDHPVFYLRKVLFDRLGTSADRRKSTAHYASVLIRAWNAYAREETVDRFLKGTYSGKIPTIFDPHGFIEDRWPLVK